MWVGLEHEVCVKTEINGNHPPDEVAAGSTTASVERAATAAEAGAGSGTPGGNRSTSKDTSTLTVLPPSSSCMHAHR